MNRFVYGLSVVLSALLVLSGCGEAETDVTVSGKVTVDGAPIPTGAINFVDPAGIIPTGGGVIADGSYTAKVQPGEKVVMVLGNKLIGQEPLYEGVADSPMRDKYEMITPEAYNAAHLSPLKATITDSQEGLDFDLDSKLKIKPQ